MQREKNQPNLQPEETKAASLEPYEKPAVGHLSSSNSGDKASPSSTEITANYGLS
ncbi:MAG: hypothetical protein WCS27_17155 [Victivallaceae bacterium]|jgi:hypothetical protein